MTVMSGNKLTYLRKMEAYQPVFEAIRANERLNWLDCNAVEVNDEGEIGRRFKPVTEYFELQVELDVRKRPQERLESIATTLRLCLNLIGILVANVTCVIVGYKLSGVNTDKTELWTLILAVGAIILGALAPWLIAMHITILRGHARSEWEKLAEESLRNKWRSVEFIPNLEQLVQFASNTPAIKAGDPGFIDALCKYLARNVCELQTTLPPKALAEDLMSCVRRHVRSNKLEELEIARGTDFGTDDMRYLHDQKAVTKKLHFMAVRMGLTRNSLDSLYDEAEKAIKDRQAITALTEA